MMYDFVRGQSSAPRARHIGYILSALIGLLLHYPKGSQAQSWEKDLGFTLPPIEGGQTPTGSFPVAALPDGRVLMTKASGTINGRPASNLVRLNPDSSIDAGFVPPSFDGIPRVVHVYRDGRVLVVDGSNSLMRLLGGGARDATFAATPLQSDITLKAAETPTGQVWIWGSLRIGPTAAGVALLKAGGGWEDGFQFTPPSSLRVTDAVVRSDGKLVASGSVAFPGSTPLLVFLLNTDGTIDRGFDTSKSYPISRSVPLAVSLAGEGKLLVAAERFITRLMSDGSTDESYRMPQEFDGTYLGVGRAGPESVIYCFTAPTPRTVRLNRLSRDGAWDTSFRVDGDSFGMRTGDAAGLGPLQFPSSWDDQILYFPTAITEERKNRRLLITRTLGTGAVDTEFSVRFSTTPALSTPLRQEDGKYLVSGFFDHVDGVPLGPLRSNLIRLNVDGSLDRSFRPTVASSPTTGSGTPYAVESSGKILVRAADGALQRLNYDGTPDGSYRAPAGLSAAVFFNGSFYLKEDNGQLVRFSVYGVRETEFAPVNTTNLFIRGAGANGIVICEEGNRSTSLNKSKFVWLSRTGMALGSTEQPYTTDTILVLPDASIISFSNQATADPRVRTIVVSRFDTTGQRVMMEEVAAELMAVATRLSEVLMASGGGDVAVDLTAQRLRSRVHVHDNQIILLPESNTTTGYGMSFPLDRFRPRGLPSLPAIVSVTPTITVAPGQSVALTVTTTGSNLTYSYGRDGSPATPLDAGRPLSGGSYTVLLPPLAASDAGVYRFSVSGGPSTTITRAINVTVSASAEASRLANVSVRTFVGPDDQSLIVGFVIGGGGANSTMPVLARGVGPSLAAFSVPNFLADPVVFLRSAATVIHSNDNWSGSPQINLVSGQVGAFPFVAATSRDAAIYSSGLPAAAYTMQIAGAGNLTGDGLAEIYDATTPTDLRAGTARLVNLSCRASVTSTGEALIAGFVVAGGTAKTLLVRAVGPSLGGLGVSGFLRSGQLAIHDGSGAKIAENLGAGFDIYPMQVTAQVGAFPLAADQRDNVLLVTLPPGPYTAQVRGTNGNSGVALIEVYEVP